jgi:hypothetical protein
MQDFRASVAVEHGSCLHRNADELGNLSDLSIIGTPNDYCIVYV